MAFMGIFLVWIIAAAVIFCGFAGIVCFVISIVIKRRYEKRAALDTSVKKPSSPFALKIVGWVLLVPLIGAVLLTGYFAASTALKSENSLWHNVRAGNFERVEELIDSGVSPDCTVNGNEPAKDGEKTILISLCEHYGSAYDTEYAEQTVKMARLLIEKGADIEYKYYCHAENDHGDNPVSDGCGRTPLLCAVEHGDYELVRLLVESGADINARDFCGYNAIAIIAGEKNDISGADIARYLVENGADTECTTKAGDSVRSLLHENKKYGNEKIREILGYK